MKNWKIGKLKDWKIGRLGLQSYKVEKLEGCWRIEKLKNYG
jgi:hypothetical protein